MIFKNFLGKRNEDIKSLIYDMDEVEKLEKEYLKTSSPALSPIIKANLKAIRNYRNGDSKALDGFIPKGTDPDTYLEELAKVNIFITEKVKCPDDFTREMLIESAFASYQYQKINNLPFSKFEDFFSTDDKKPFHIFNEVVITDGKPLNSEINGQRVNGIMYLNKSMDYQKYTISLMKTITHELQHVISNNGTYEKHNFLGRVFNSATGLNEMCTEWNAEQIVTLLLDSDKVLENGEENKKAPYRLEKDTLLTDSGSKELSFCTKAKDYRELVSFYEAINFICKEDLRNLYYDREKRFNIRDAFLNKSPIKITINSEIYNVTGKAYWDLTKDKKSSYKNHIFLEKRFDDIIDSFTSLATRYVKSKLKISPKVDLDELSNYRKAKQLQQFFDTFDNISFIKEGETLTQGEIIKRRVLFNIYQDEKKVDDALEALNIYKEVKENESKDTSTILSSEKAPEENLKTTEVNSSLDTDTLENKNLATINDIDSLNNAKCSKNNNNYKSKNKDNSKDIDLDL